MKPHIALKNGKYWIWSSRAASLDCMPRHLCKGATMTAAAIKQMNKVNKNEKI